MYGLGQELSGRKDAAEVIPPCYTEKTYFVWHHEIFVWITRDEKRV